VASVSTLFLLITTAKAQPVEAIRLLGWWPIAFSDITRCCLLTFLLFLGPLFERIFVERDLDDFRHGRAIVESLSSWIGYRNFVAGPVTEEVVFRSVLIPIHLLAKISPTRIVFLTPLYFGIAHVHHFYEFKLTHPHTPFVPAFLHSVFQFAYTTLFGWFAAFIYLRTGSIYACIVIHTFCNWAGLPRFWGRVNRTNLYSTSLVPIRVKDDVDAVSGRGSGQLHLGWTIAYYVLLVSGAYAFYLGLWFLTESSQPLASFKGDQKAYFGVKKVLGK
jgi:prenyl protein peptidase